ncbi:hypothetical protein [Wolbachia endosymbiont (group A) of Ennomos erosarius]
MSKDKAFKILGLNTQLYEHYNLSLPEGCHPSAQTLGSRNFDWALSW